MYVCLCQLMIMIKTFCAEKGPTSHVEDFKRVGGQVVVKFHDDCCWLKVDGRGKVKGSGGMFHVKRCLIRGKFCV